MKKSLFPIVLFGLIMGGFGCTEFDSLEKKEARYGKASPVIHQSFAAKEIWPGAPWKVYLIASDLDGDMKNIVCTIDQPGVGIYPVSITQIAEGKQKEFPDSSTSIPRALKA